MIVRILFLSLGLELSMKNKEKTGCKNRYSSMPAGETLKAKIAGTSDSVALPFSQADMKKLIIHSIIVLISSTSLFAQWPMSNDTTFDATVNDPAFEKGEGPKILLDGGHHNFLIQWNFIKPFSDLAKADGYHIVVDSALFTPDYLVQFDIVMIITALPFDFTTKNEVTDESTYTEQEISNLYQWVQKGGSLLVFSEHAPFDQAINPLLNQFGITSSIGLTIDTLNQDSSISNPFNQYWIRSTDKNGLLNMNHPIVKGRNDNETIHQLLSFGGSGLSGGGYDNLIKLSPSSKNIKWVGVGPSGRGNSQCLAGKVGSGRLVALGDSNGFVAMLFDLEDGSKFEAGMNVENYDWKQFVLNTLHWLSNK